MIGRDATSELAGGRGTSTVASATGGAGGGLGRSAVTPGTARISVVVSTRNRPSDAIECARSILANQGDDFDLLVVDQSDDHLTGDGLAELSKDPRFRYIRSDTRGLSRSRNVGIESTSAPVIAFTDDDCRVPADWIACWLKVFAGSPAAGIIYGRVTAPDDVDGSHRYAATFEPTTREHHNAFPAPDEPWGIGANMAFRRTLFDRLGKFDPLLGAGATFPAAEEYDLTIRALAAGMMVVHAAEVSVLHLGVREREVASKLVRGYGVAIGATLAKHVRLGTKDGGRLLASWVATHGAGALRNAVTGRRPTNLGFVGALLLGIVRSCREPIDVAGRVYTQRRRP